MTSSTGTASRRARSIATSRACHVGARSSLSASSPSSSTTTAARSGTGAHTAVRPPTTTHVTREGSLPRPGPFGRRLIRPQRRPPRDPSPRAPAPVRRSAARQGAPRSSTRSPRAARDQRHLAATPAPTGAPAPATRGGRGGTVERSGRRRSGTADRPNDPASGTIEGGDAARRNATTGPAHRHAAHSPSRDQLSRRTGADDLRERSESRRIGVGLDVGLDDPAAYRPPVQRHPHDRADDDVVPVGHEVVEDAVDRRQIGSDPTDPQDFRSLRLRRPGRSGPARCARSGERFRGLLERLGLLGPLPGEVAVGTAEVSVRRGLLVDRPTQVEALDDRGRAEVELLPDQLTAASTGRSPRSRRSRP